MSAKILPMIPNQSFTEEQKQYLEGFFVGASKNPYVGRTAGGLLTSDPAKGSVNLAAEVEENVYGTPVDELSKEEVVKYEQNGLDVWDKLVEYAEADVFPQGGDVFRFKFFGLFHVTPAQDSFMLRGRVAGGIIKSHQFAGVAEIAEDWGGGYVDLTTRGNFQVREIMPKHTVLTLMKLRDLGLTSMGSGADNLRNITASPTTGFDTQELLDVSSYANAMHHYILNNRDMYGLPRKFNISFDAGGTVSVCADTNDIAFQAVRVGEGHEIEPGIYFRVELCGITGHKQFAADSGILIKPEESIAVAAAMIRVFLENGDRTNRKKARLKYLVDKWGIPKFLEETEKKLDRPFVHFAKEQCEPRVAPQRHAHYGVHPQSEAGLNYVGVVVPVGRMLPEQVRQVAQIANRYGNGEIRLTVWQNLLIPNIHDEDLEAVKKAIVETGLHYQTTNILGGLIACTGSAGCKFAASSTKAQARILGDYLNERMDLDQPINIHLTGCNHSCAQHYIGDIGMIGTKVKVDGESKDGYSIVLGGGVDNEQAIAKEIFKSVPFDEIPPLLETVLKIYHEKRNEGESFTQFTQRHSEADLKTLFANNYVNL